MAKIIKLSTDTNVDSATNYVSKSARVADLTLKNCERTIRKEFIQGTCHANITLEKIASDIGLHPRTLQRHLAINRLTFQKLLDNVRLSHAALLMQNYDNKLMDIAVQVGYSEQSHFCRAFKRWKGITPSKYRRLQQENCKLISSLRFA